MTKREQMSADEFEYQDSPVLAVLKYYGSPLTRDEYLAVSYLGKAGLMTKFQWMSRRRSLSSFGE